MVQKKYLDVSVIILFKDRAKMTVNCIQSLLKYGPEVKEIILVSNGSSDAELGIARSFAQHHKTIVLLEYNHPFNYQKINNWAVSKSSGAFILFLNNDTELVSQSIGLLEKMAKKASLPGVGITGCLLLYGDRSTIQHAGVFLLPRGTADHLYVGKKLRAVLKFRGSAKFPYDITKDTPMTAVTGAVSMVEKKKLLQIEGFDEKFIVCGGDVDLCIRLNEAGYQTWFVSGGHILHKESQSRSQKPISYNDFYYSYLSYIKGYNSSVGDPYLPLITQGM